MFLLGQSNGGSVALRQAWTGNVAGVIALYPWCGELPRDVAAWAAPALILAAGADDWTPPAACIETVREIRSDRVEVQIFPDAHHSFDLDVPTQRFAGHTVGGNAVAAAGARQAMLAFLAKHAGHAQR